MGKLILMVLGSLTGLMFLISVLSYVGDSKKRARYSQCTGTIQRIWKRLSLNNDHGKQYRISPIVQYTVNGKAYEMVGNHYSKDMEPGQQVIILYDPDDPSKAILKKGLYGMSLVTGIVGGAFAVGCIVVAVLKYTGVLSS